MGFTFQVEPVLPQSLTRRKATRAPTRRSRAAAEPARPAIDLVGPATSGAPSLRLLLVGLDPELGGSLETAGWTSRHAFVDDAAGLSRALDDGAWDALIASRRPGVTTFLAPALRAGVRCLVLDGDGEAELPATVEVVSTRSAGALGSALARVVHERDTTRALSIARQALAASEERFRATQERLERVLSSSPTVLYALFVEGDSLGLTWVSRNMETLLGYTVDEAMEPAWWEKSLHPDDRPDASANVARLFADGQLTHEYRLRHRDGAWIWVRDAMRLRRDAKGRPAEIFGSWADITERREAEQVLQRDKAELEARVDARTSELRASEERLQVVAQATHEANEKLKAWVAELEQRNGEMALLGEMGELLQTCTTAEEAYDVVAHSGGQLFRGDSGALYVFRNSRNLVERAATWGASPPPDHGFEPDECWALRRGRLHVMEGSGGLRCPHLEDAATSGSLCIPMMAQGEALGVLHLRCGADELAESRRRFAQTVAESLGLGLANLRLREALRSQAIRDPLTGLFNRRFMEEALAREMRRAVRRVSPLAILMLDLDHFKRLNDTLGHDAGDALLRELGLFLQNHVRSADIACRYGGEEITLILPDATLAHARQRAEELREGVHALVIQDRARTIGPVTVSIGIAGYPEHGESGDTLLRAADAALYAAKAAGRDRVVVAAL